ncbi:MAG: hypothetical protein PHW52_01745 [Candidatus Pacebacteria bacterium]|nr:hypothetical protein [Candidatus Paceibacterota bacterium]
MNIDITKEQYEKLIVMLGIANSVVGILGDTVADEGKDYKEMSDEMERVESYFLEFAKDFGHPEMVEDYEGEIIMVEDFYEEIYSIVDEYDNYTTYDTLSNVLAKRDFRRDHTEKEIESLLEKNHGYLGVELYEYEKKYWDEFDEYDYERLEIVKH